MNKLSIAVLGLLVFTGAANAETRLQTCAKAWAVTKQAPDYAKPAKGEGRAAWNKFRTECIAKLPKPERVAKATKAD